MCVRYMYVFQVYVPCMFKFWLVCTIAKLYALNILATYINHDGFQKTDQMVKLGLFHFIAQAN